MRWVKINTDIIATWMDEEKGEVTPEDLIKLEMEMNMAFNHINLEVTKPASTVLLRFHFRKEIK
jgi:hypothetical protein